MTGIAPRILALASILAAATIATSFTASAQPALSGVAKIVSHADNNCAVTTAGGAWCWGSNSHGQLGAGTLFAWRAAIGVTGMASGVATIAPGWGHTCASTTTGDAFCWGFLVGGQPTPAAVGFPPGITAIASGDYHACALTPAGGVKCWGSNMFGQIGNNSTVDANSPADVVGLASGVVAVVGGQIHTCALTGAGAVKCWGSGNEGQLGSGSSGQSSVPLPVSGLSSGVVAIAAGEAHTCALTTSAGVKCWGRYVEGQLGDPSLVANALSPVDVPDLISGVAAIALGARHTCALLTTGTVKCWGLNAAGQLGDTTLVNRSAPVTASVLTGTIAALSAGTAHTCALSGGGVKCWGSNGQGQLGSNTIADRMTPADVLALMDITPDAFGFDPQPGVPLNSRRTSNTVTISGIDRDAPITVSPITVSNGYYSLDCTASFINTPGIIMPGQSVCLRHDAAQYGGVSTTTTLTVGTVSGTFTSTTGVFPTTTTVSGPATSTPGAMVTFDVRIGGQSWMGQGTITFKDGGAVIAGCSALASASYPSCSTSSLSPGVHSITAEYGDDPGAQSSVSAAFMHGVGTSSATLNIAKTGPGGGTVASNVSGIACGETCSAAFPSGIAITLTATPNANSLFVSWSGCSSVSGNACTIGSLTGSVTATARFTLIVPIPPSAPTLGSASGGNTVATIRFAPPDSDGGAAVTGYTATCNPGTHTATGAAAPLTVTGLTNGVGYDCTIAASNSAGTGSPTIALRATPLASIAGPLAYIVKSSDDTVAVLDTATNLVTSTISAGSGVGGIAVSPSGTRVYVTNYGGNNGTTISVIDTGINFVTNTVTVGTGPRTIALNPAGTRAYVANYISNNVSIVDTATLSVIHTVPVPTPSKIAVNPLGHQVYVTSGATDLAVIDVATRAVTTIALGSGFSSGVAVNPAGTRAYVPMTLFTGSRVAVVDLAAGSVISSVSGFVGAPTGIAVNPAGTRTYVANSSTTVTLWTIDNSTNSVLTVRDMYPSPGWGTCPSSCYPNVDVAMNPSGTRIYMAAGEFHQVAVLDAATGSLMTTVEIAGGSMMIAFAPPPLVISPNDLNDDGKSDLLWRNSDGSVQGWLMNGLSVTQIAGLLPAGGYAVTHIADLDGDGKDDLVISSADGTITGWLMNGLAAASAGTVAPAGSGWTVMKTGDLDGDGKADLIAQHTNGTVVGWIMNGLTVNAVGTFVGAGSGWSVSQVLDLDGDGTSDLVWQHTNGTVQAWLMDGLAVTSIASYVPAGTGWSVVLTGDFNGDGKADLVWQHTNGASQAWLMDGLAITGIASFTPAGTGWVPKLAGDLNGDQKSDIFWEHSSGASQTWLMDGLTVTTLASYVPGGTGWVATHVMDFNGDGKKDVVWKHTSGGTQAWLMNGLNIMQIGSFTGAGAYAIVPMP